MHVRSIVVTATFTAEPVEAPLEFWMDEIGQRASIKFAPYNQVFQQLLDPSSLLATNRHGVNVVLVRVEDWQRFHRTAASKKDLGVLSDSERQGLDRRGAASRRPIVDTANRCHLSQRSIGPR